MKKEAFVVALAIGAGVLAARLSAEDAPAAGGSASADQSFPSDSGPDFIDVSSYPVVQQENYKVFGEKCAKCHTLARPINAPLATSEEWQAYVDKMMHKKRSGVDEDSAKRIVDFLVYDSSVRKKDLLAQKLKDKAKTDASANAKPAPSPGAGEAAPGAK